jgi:hypothetical protein
MKRAVSISIGSSKRNKTVEVEMLGEKVQLERIGTDGDMEAAARMYGELDGKVDAFGVGGAVLGLMVGNRWHTLNSVQKLVRYVKKTPIVDGTGLKMTLESQAAATLEKALGEHIGERRALLISGVDRYGLTHCFIEAGYDSVIGDLMFTLGLSIPLRSEASLNTVASILLPLLSRVPFSWLYPTGEAQDKHTPKFTKYFEWATVVAGDCHYITKYMPDDMNGKIIVTNTTTPEDREVFKKSGIRCLVTTTPMLDGRSFGTNVIEAGIVAVMGRKEPLDYANPGTHFQDMEKALKELNISPQVQEL